MEKRESFKDVGEREIERDMGEVEEKYERKGGRDGDCRFVGNFFFLTFFRATFYQYNWKLLPGGPCAVNNFFFSREGETIF